MGQTHVQQHMPALLELIEAGKLNPAAIITHRLRLEDAQLGYKLFDRKEQECRKVVLVPGLSPSSTGTGPALMP